MDPKAVSKAKARLDIAKQQLGAAENAESYTAFTAAWYLFLVAAKNVYTTLEQGAKSSPQSRQWFGKRKNDRKSDPLLQYLFQARDDDEHGLADVTRLQPGSLAIGKAAPGYSSSMHIDRLEIKDGKVHIGKITSLDGKPVLIENIPAHAVLMPVTGRGNITYNPPETHRGEKLADTLPITIGELGLTYLEELVSEAADKAA